MKRVSLIALMLVAPAMFSQTALGPAAGSVPSGASVSTESFQAEAPSSYPGPVEEESEPVKFPIHPAPTPADAPPPTGPEGSNAIRWQKDRLSKLNGLPITLGSFQGLPQSLAAGIPPDPYVAVGPNHIVGVINSTFRIFDKSGNVLKTIGANGWFNNVLTNSGPFDPKVCYDHFNNRWIMVWLSQNSGAMTAYMLISVSDDDDPLGTWYNWALPANLNGTTDANNWSDYEGVGFDQTALYITSNQWSFPGSFQYSKLRIIGTAQLYQNTAGAITWNDLWDIRDAIGNKTAGVRPVRIYGAPTEYYLVGWPSFTTSTYVVLFRVADPLGTPGVTAVDIPVVAFSQSTNADQLGGSSTLIETTGSTLLNEPTYRDSSIWLAHSVASGSGNKYASLSMLRLNTVTNTAAEDFAFGLDGYWFIYPALAVDTGKNVMITFTLTGQTQYAGAYFSWRTNSDPPGLQPIEIMQEGAGHYVVTGGSGRNRWGDYNGIALDPADQNNFWMLSEYAAGTNSFGTWAHGARLVPFSGPRLTASSTSLNFGTLETGMSSDATTVTLENTGSDVLTVSSITRNNPDFAVAGIPSLPAQLSTFENIQLQVSFAPSGHGVVADTLLITSDDPVTPGKMIPLSGNGLVIGRAQPGVFYSTSGPISGKTYTLDGTTAVPTEVGSLTIGEIQSLAIRPSTRQLYGTAANSTNTSLYRVSSDFGDVLLDRVIPIPNMRAIAFGGGDTLYGGTTSGRLYRISMTTGDTSTVGVSSPIAVYSAFAFNPITHVLWASVRPPLVGKDKVYTVDTQTGMATEIGATGFAVITAGIAFDPLGNLYGLTGLGSQTNSLISIDQLSGVGTLIGSTGINGLNALALRDDSLGTTGVVRESNGIPRTFVLLQNYPNPFNPSTSITYGLPSASIVRLSIFNLIGQTVATLVDREQEAGFHTAVWDGKDTNGGAAASGVYICRIEASAPGGQTFTEAKKLLLLK